jgi:hypothetical protein
MERPLIKNSLQDFYFPFNNLNQIELPKKIETHKYKSISLNTQY